MASISGDQRIGLFTLPLINYQTNAPLIVGTDGSADGPKLALKLILESLGFPKR